MVPPKTLYKYRSISPDLRGSYAQSILARSNIYLSSPDQFNDPFECQAEVVIDKDDPLVAGTSRLEVLERVRSNLRRRMLVYSMSALNDNMLMWSHYANRHRGICLGFDAESRDDVFSFAEPVIYQDVLPKYDLRPEQDVIEGAKRVALVKGTRWSYEQEWRIVVVARALDQERKLDFNATSLTEVILGCDISNNDRLAVQVALAMRDSPVILYQAHRNALRYSVEILPIGRISSECLREENFIDADQLLPRDSEEKKG